MTGPQPSSKHSLASCAFGLLAFCSWQNFSWPVLQTSDNPSKLSTHPTSSTRSKLISHSMMSMHASLFFLEGSDCWHERRSHQALEQWLEAFQSLTFQHFFELSLEAWEGWLQVICMFDGLEAPIQFSFSTWESWLSPERRSGALFLTDLLLCLAKVHQKHYHAHDVKL